MLYSCYKEQHAVSISYGKMMMKTERKSHVQMPG